MRIIRFTLDANLIRIKCTCERSIIMIDYKTDENYGDQKEFFKELNFGYKSRDESFLMISGFPLLFYF